MRNLLAKILIYGDIHLRSSNYGAHNDYSTECLEYFSKITATAEKIGATHIIGLGDLSFGRFQTLEFRKSVEEQLTRQYELTRGNRFELFGNHDEAGYGMTERDYYIDKGLIKPSENITIGNTHITMIDYGKIKEVVPNIVDNEESVNVVLAHDYYKFANSNLPNFGKAIELDELEKLFGADIMICGHVHSILNFEGDIIRKSDNMSHRLKVMYPGCMSRPAYHEGGMDEHGELVVISVYDDGMDIDTEIIELWSLDKSFNLEKKAKEALKKEEAANRVDISDIVKQLDMHDRNIGNPEDIIGELEGVDDKYKNKAIELLRDAMG